MIGGDEDFIGGEFAGAVQINWVGSLVGGEGEHGFDFVIEGCLYDVFRTDDVGFDKFEGVIFGGDDLFQGRGVDNVIDFAEGHFKALCVADITEEEAQFGRVFVRGKFLLHLVLFEFVAGEDDYFIWIGVIQQIADKILTEGAGPSGDEYILVIKK